MRNRFKHATDGQAELTWEAVYLVQNGARYDLGRGLISPVCCLSQQWSSARRRQPSNASMNMVERVASLE